MKKQKPNEHPHKHPSSPEASIQVLLRISIGIGNVFRTGWYDYQAEKWVLNGEEDELFAREMKNQTFEWSYITFGQQSVDELELYTALADLHRVTLDAAAKLAYAQSKLNPSDPDYSKYQKIREDLQVSLLKAQTSMTNALSV